MKPLLIVLAACAVRPTEIVVVPASPPPGPWLALRDAITSCAHQHGLAGEVHIRVAIDPDGGPGSVTSDLSDSIAVCIGRSIAQWRYHTHANRIMDIRFVVGPA